MICTQATPSYSQGFARCADESAHPQLWNGLVGAWIPEIGPSGSVLFDISGRGHHGTLVNLEIDTDWALYDGGTFLNTATNEHVTGTFEQIDTACTILTFFKTGASGTSRPINIGDSASDVFYFAIDANIGNDFSYWYRAGAAQSTVYTAQVPSANTWYMVAGAAYGNVRELFINGISVDQTISTAFPTPINIFGLGDLIRANNIGSACGVGLSLVYNRALSAQEVMLIYADPLALVRRRADIFPFVVVAAGANVPSKFYHYNRSRCA